MIVLLTDFGREGPYVGQMTAVLRRLAPEIAVVDLLADAPAHDPRMAAYLLAAYAGEFPAGTVFLCVVDPGVGGQRPAGYLELDGKFFVGPDNGLFEIVGRRAKGRGVWQDVLWRPAAISASFHGRDLFAPVAARLARGMPVDARERKREPLDRGDWPDDLRAVIYIDAFGNAMTGMRAAMLSPNAVLQVHGHRIAQARTFGDVPPGSPFWYKNANGLVEIAVNRGRANQVLGLAIGAEFSVNEV